MGMPHRSPLLDLRLTQPNHTPRYGIKPLIPCQVHVTTRPQPMRASHSPIATVRTLVARKRAFTCVSRLRLGAFRVCVRVRLRVACVQMLPAVGLHLRFAFAAFAFRVCVSRLRLCAIKGVRRSLCTSSQSQHDCWHLLSAGS